MILVQVDEMGAAEIQALISRSNYGHLGCCRDGRPYVVPINYVYAQDKLYIFTTEGKKFDIIRENPKVCLQIESVESKSQWESVIVDGDAVQIEPGEEYDLAREAILEINPTLTPALSIRWMDAWVRENIEVIFRIDITQTSGRRTGFDKPHDIN